MAENLSETEDTGDGPDDPVKALRRRNLLKALRTAGIVLATLPAAGLLGLLAAVGPEETMTTLETGYHRLADSASGAGAETDAEETFVYLPLPDLMINAAPETGLSLLRIKVFLKAAPASVNAVRSREPELLDLLQDFFRQVDAADVQGSAGMFRLRSEILRRVNLLLGDSPVEQVLITDLLAQ